jgi:hypothetical protein
LQGCVFAGKELEIEDNFDENSFCAAVVACKRTMKMMESFVFAARRNRGSYEVWLNGRCYWSICAF